jgi:hypothetical protein
MKRTTTKAPLGKDEAKVTVRIESEPCERNSVEARREATELLRALVSNPELLSCGYSPFQTLAMFHDGERWIVELQATSFE